LEGANLAKVDLWGAKFENQFFEYANTEGIFIRMEPNARPVAVTAEQVAEWLETIAKLHQISSKTSKNDRVNIIARSICDDLENAAAIRGVINRNSHLLIKYISITAFQSIISDKRRCPAAEGLTKEDWRKLAEAVAAEREWLINFEAKQWYEQAKLKW
jgi:hypothetical protein